MFNLLNKDARTIFDEILPVKGAFEPALKYFVIIIIIK